MAQRVETILIDDIDGSSAAETVNFALDGVNYVIDLNSENASRLRADLQEWINYARRARNGRRRTTTPAVSNSESRRMPRSTVSRSLTVAASPLRSARLT